MQGQIDQQLLNDFQRDFPLCSTPYLTIATTLNSSEHVVLDQLTQLTQEGKISRIGPVFAPRRVGASTLAAMSVPPEQLTHIANIVSRFSAVNHNYARTHRYNLWFVVTANTEEALSNTLSEIELATALPLLNLPLEQAFHIDLGFCLSGKKPKHQTAQAPLAGNIAALSETDRRLIFALQQGLPLAPQPFETIAALSGLTEELVLKQIHAWLADGTIKRFGVIVHHHELGYRANAMLVHDIPDHQISEIGRALADEPSVTLCYQRPRRLPEWQHNLFCMIHGRCQDEVQATIKDIRQRHGLTHCHHEVLFSTTRYKQNGARYV